MSARSGGSLRIIGGSWRGRKLPVPDVAGLRPTGDRIRETLFNWLAADIPGANCLDLFAGSGALGLEALSRGAAHCYFVERDAGAHQCLLESLELLKATHRATSFHGTAEAALSALTKPENASEPFTPFTLAFLDPPFADGLLEECLSALANSALLGDDARIYLEHARETSVELPTGWTYRRQKQSGSVSYALLERED